MERSGDKLAMMTIVVTAPLWLPLLWIGYLASKIKGKK